MVLLLSLFLMFLLFLLRMLLHDVIVDDFARHLHTNDVVNLNTNGCCVVLCAISRWPK